ncbi:B12-binding domain-containing radical SAM protein [Verrucomicrobiota bacterium]
MKVMLVHCRFSPNTWESCLPLGIGSLSEYARSRIQGLEINVLDANVLDLREDQVLQHVISFRPKVLGLSFMTPQADYAYALTELIKNDSRCENIRIIHGGVHPTALPKEALDHGADVCVVGEGELTFCELLEALLHNRDFSRIPGTACIKDGRVITAPERPLIEDLDILPFPQWQEFPLNRYTQTLHLENGPALPIMGSRGCPHSCSFCFSPRMWRRKVRFMSAERIVTAMSEACETLGISRFHFYDDDFLCSPKWAESFCEKLIENKGCFHWVCLVRPDSVCRNRLLLALMQKAGCVGVEMGVDSTDDEVLKGMTKGFSGDMAREAIGALHEAGMPLAVLEIMTCNPGETLEKHYEMGAVLRELTGCDHVFLGHFATPYPGTEFYRRAQHEGVMLAKKWSEYQTEKVTFIPDSLLQERPRMLKPTLSALDRLLTRIYCVCSSRRQVSGPVVKAQKEILNIFQDLDGSKTVEQVLHQGLSETENVPESEVRAMILRALLVWAQIGAVGTKSARSCARSSWTDSCPDSMNPGEWYHRNKANLYRHSIDWRSL